jgi:hypothetical protein
VDSEAAALFLARHPGLVAVAFAVLVGAVGYNTFAAGVSYQRLRCTVSAADRAVSEALGG